MSDLSIWDFSVEEVLGTSRKIQRDEVSSFVTQEMVYLEPPVLIFLHFKFFRHCLFFCDVINTCINAFIWIDQMILSSLKYK